MMKFKFKVQQYQSDAVKSIVKVFDGQPKLDLVRYTRDLGIRKKGEVMQANLFDAYEKSDEGFENAKIVLPDETLFENIKAIQQDNNIKISETLVSHLGRCSLDIEMETGTGKTYVYIKSIFELNEKYGWSKFIIVVPSIAIREGVRKSFEMMEDHFYEAYGKKARYFIYNSKNLTRLDSYASSADIQVMIINAQAFNARGVDARRIDMILDDFQSRRPIDVIAKNRPIVILDEPQKLGGDATQTSLKKFNPLFCMNFSATHKKQNNLIYCLDALDAYNKKLVKKIQVKGFEIKNLRGTDKYIYLQDIVIAKDKPPMAKIEFEINYKKSINRETRLLEQGRNLYDLSAGKDMPKLEQYKEGYTISEINPFTNSITFLNGEKLTIGEVVGDISEKDLRRIQIRETVISHFEKEEILYQKGIKCLSLFFIDEVAKYRDYSQPDEKGEYARVFEEEYTRALNDIITIYDTPYTKYLKKIATADTHKGYFSIDKKTNRFVDSSTGKKQEESDDISAYDLILKNKERLLSFEEPTRFIFSHSALREGWDNPNVFQICTLKHSDSSTAKRQEVGRGLRIAVTMIGERADQHYCGTTGNDFHKLNCLTVIATESYKNFVGDLQKETKLNLADRPTKATQDYFIGKTVKDGDNTIIVDKELASDIYSYLKFSGYIEKDGKVTESYRVDQDNGALKPVPEILKPYEQSIHRLVQGVFDESIINEMFENAHQTKVVDNDLNENFYKKEFQTLWNYINHKYSYRVDFDSEELIKKAIEHLDEKLYVTELKYTVTIGDQRKTIEKTQIERGDSFANIKTRTESIKSGSAATTPYDLIGKIAEGTTLTRKTIVRILQGIQPFVFEKFKLNPEEFISKAIRLINEQKATMIVDHVTYDTTENKYDIDIFTGNQIKADFSKVLKATKHISDYVVTDGTAEKSVERVFAEDLENASEVCVYAKLPRTFQIPTPVGNYAPDWAIAFNEGTVKHIYFVAETKGSMSSMVLDDIEKAKIKCAKKLFNELSTSKVRYHEVASYQDLLDVIQNKF